MENKTTQFDTEMARLAKLTREEREAECRAQVPNATDEQVKDAVDCQEWAGHNAKKLQVNYAITCAMNGVRIPFMMFVAIVWKEIGREEWKTQKAVNQN